jgi:hypothetical protein
MSFLLFQFTRQLVTQLARSLQSRLQLCYFCVLLLTQVELGIVLVLEVLIVLKLGLKLADVRKFKRDQFLLERLFYLAR